MDSYQLDIQLEMEHWLANTGYANNNQVTRQAIIVGYYGGRVDNANCREQYSAAMDLYKEAQLALTQILKDVK